MISHITILKEQFKSMQRAIDFHEYEFNPGEMPVCKWSIYSAKNNKMSSHDLQLLSYIYQHLQYSK